MDEGELLNVSCYIPDASSMYYPLTRTLSIIGFFGGSYHAPLGYLCAHGSNPPVPYSIEKLVFWTVMGALICTPMFGSMSYMFEKERVNRLETIIQQAHEIFKQEVA
jgi:hypothetical protein